MTIYRAASIVWLLSELITRVAALAVSLPRVLEVPRSVPGCDSDLWREFVLCKWRSGEAKCQLDLPSLTPLLVDGCGRLQLGAAHWATLWGLHQVVDK